MPGITREHKGDQFRYRHADGTPLTDADELARIRRLAIPPAYTDVWICPLPRGHLQATGLDARGRREYRYHPEWRLQRDEGKFERMLAFGHALPRIRARVARDLSAHRSSKSPLTRNLVLATLVRLLDTTYLRVGNEEYASTNRSYGLTTLRTRHANLRGSELRLRFRGKSGVQQEARLSDPRVARVVRRCQQLPGQELFQYKDDDGTPNTVGSADVNDYLREISGSQDGQGLSHLARHRASAGADAPGLQPAGPRGLERQTHPGRGGAAAGQHARGVQEVVRAPRRVGAGRAPGVRCGPGHAGRVAAHGRKCFAPRAKRGRAAAAGLSAHAAPQAGSDDHLSNRARHGEPGHPAAGRVRLFYRPTISPGTTHWSNCAPVTWPDATAASRRLVPSLSAFLAMNAALS